MQEKLSLKYKKDVHRHDTHLPSAEVPADSVDIQRKLTSDSVQACYAKRIGIREYVIPQPEASELAQWKEGVEMFLLPIRSGDFGALHELINKRIDGNILVSYLEQANLSAEEKVMTAIGLWILTNKGRFPGNNKARWKVFKGGVHPLSDTLDQDGDPTCLDVNVLYNLMAGQFGIAGDIYTLKNRFSHRFWMSTSGKIVDIGWSSQTGGLVRTEESYEAIVQKKMRKM